MTARWRRIALLCVLAAWIGVAWRQAVKPLPPGLHVASLICEQPAGEVDVPRRHHRGGCLRAPGREPGDLRCGAQVVRAARRFIVLDYSGFGADADAAGSPQRRMRAALTDALLERRRSAPDLRVLFITDPANERYGAARSPELQLLRAAGVEVVLTELDRLRDSNLAYSSLWRLALRWWDTPSGPLGRRDAAPQLQEPTTAGSSSPMTAAADSPPSSARPRRATAKAAGRTWRRAPQGRRARGAPRERAGGGAVSPAGRGTSGPFLAPRGRPRRRFRAVPANSGRSARAAAAVPERRPRARAAAHRGRDPRRAARASRCDAARRPIDVADVSSRRARRGRVTAGGGAARGRACA